MWLLIYYGLVNQVGFFFFYVSDVARCGWRMSAGLRVLDDVSSCERLSLLVRRRGHQGYKRHDRLKNKIESYETCPTEFLFQGPIGAHYKSLAILGLELIEYGPKSVKQCKAQNIYVFNVQFNNNQIFILKNNNNRARFRGTILKCCFLGSFLRFYNVVFSHRIEIYFFIKQSHG